jgi:hypothetical protein
LLAAIAVIVFTDRLQERKMLSSSQETGRRNGRSLMIARPDV